MGIHHAKEVYSGMEGGGGEGAPEGYCLKLLKEMYDELKEDDNAKNTTENPDNGKYYSYAPTDAEIKAAAEEINAADTGHIGGGYSGVINPREVAKFALEAAAKVRAKESPLP